MSAVAPEETAFADAVAAIRARRQRIDRLRAEVAALRRALSRFETLCQSQVADLVGELRRLGEAVADARRRLEDLLAATPDLAADEIDSLLCELDFELFGRLPADEPSDGSDAAVANADVYAAADDAPGEPQRQATPLAVGRADLKRLYRELAKRCHPDLADSALERDRREALMQRVNEAFQEGDVAALRTLLQETETDDPGFAHRPLAERLAWAQAELARLDGAAADLRRELSDLQSGDLHRLWRRYEAGEPVLTILEDDLERRLRTEGQRLDRLIDMCRRLEREPDERSIV